MHVVTRTDPEKKAACPWAELRGRRLVQTMSIVGYQFDTGSQLLSADGRSLGRQGGEGVGATYKPFIVTFSENTIL